MSLGTPYEIGTNTVGSNFGQGITVTTATSPGDTILVTCSNSSTGGATVSSITDSASNTYTRVTASPALPITTDEFADLWISTTGGQLTTADTISVTWSTSNGNKTHVAVGCPGVAAAVPVDQAVDAPHATGTNPTVTSGTLAQATEMAIGICINATGAGVPTGLGSFTQLAQKQSGTAPYTTVAYYPTTSVTAVTWDVTITSAVAAMILVLLLPAGAAAGPAAARPHVASQAVNRAAYF
jgi:hypothetical protein